MTSYDQHVPKSLKEMQEWFSSVITRRIDGENHINPVSPSGISIELEATKYMSPSPTLLPHQRIELYNQQYWWRLLDVLQNNFPIATRVLGYDSFNEKIGYPYLEKHKPHHWSLNHLGDTLHQWVEEEYDEDNSDKISEMIAVDWAYADSFLAGELPLPIGNEDALVESKLTLQPHVKLLSLHSNLLPFRNQLLEQDVNYWANHEFPQLKMNQNFFFVIYRNEMYNVVWSEIDQHEYRLLSTFKKEITVEEACSWIEQENIELKKAATANLHRWFQEWTARRWLGINITHE